MDIRGSCEMVIFCLTPMFEDIEHISEGLALVLGELEVI